MEAKATANGEVVTITRDMIREQLSQLGYKNVPEHILEEFLIEMNNCSLDEIEDEQPHNMAVPEPAVVTEVKAHRPVANDQESAQSGKRNPLTLRKVKRKVVRQQVQTSMEATESSLSELGELSLEESHNEPAPAPVEDAVSLGHKYGINMPGVFIGDEVEESRQTLSFDLSVDGGEAESEEEGVEVPLQAPEIIESSTPRKMKRKPPVPRLSALSRLSRPESAPSTRRSTASAVTARASIVHSTKSFMTTPKAAPGRLQTKEDPVSKYQNYRSSWNTTAVSAEKKRKKIAPSTYVGDLPVEATRPHWTPSPRAKRTPRSNDYQVPTEKKRDSLRWSIRMQMMHKESVQPRKSQPRPNTYVPPTDKRRDELRWETRARLYTAAS